MQQHIEKKKYPFPFVTYKATLISCFQNRHLLMQMHQASHFFLMFQWQYCQKYKFLFVHIYFIVILHVAYWTCQLSKTTLQS